VALVQAPSVSAEAGRDRHDLSGVVEGSVEAAVLLDDSVTLAGAGQASSSDVAAVAETLNPAARLVCHRGEPIGPRKGGGTLNASAAANRLTSASPTRGGPRCRPRGPSGRWLAR
jgi:hypothetical protein